MDITESLRTTLGTVVNFVPKAVAFLVIVVVGWIIAKILRKVVTKLLAKLGLDRVAERGGIHRFTGNFTVSRLSGTLVYLMVWLLTLQMAFGAFGPNPISTMINGLVGWLPQLFIAGVIMVVAFAIGNVVFELVSGALASMSYGRPVARGVQIAIVAVAGIAALTQIGVAAMVTTPILVTALAMVAGVVIVGVGGGLVVPMRQRWERMLGAAESEVANVRGAATAARPAGQFGQPAYTSPAYLEADRAAQEQLYGQQTTVDPVTPPVSEAPQGEPPLS